jgi:hypothetical protein
MSKALKKLQAILVSVLPDNATHRYRMEIRSETFDRIYVIAQSKAPVIGSALALMGFQAWG